MISHCPPAQSSGTRVVLCPGWRERHLGRWEGTLSHYPTVLGKHTPSSDRFRTTWEQSFGGHSSRGLRDQKLGGALAGAKTPYDHLLFPQDCPSPLYEAGDSS